MKGHVLLNFCGPIYSLWSLDFVFDWFSLKTLVSCGSSWSAEEAFPVSPLGKVSEVLLLHV